MGPRGKRHWTRGRAILTLSSLDRGGRAGDDTLLRTYWNNQATGLVNDEVFELKMEPKNWGQILFAE